MTAHPAMNHEERTRLRAAARCATQIYPGPVGELLSRELHSWEEFGYRLGSQSLIQEIVETLLNTPIEPAEAA